MLPLIIDAHQDLAYNMLAFGRDYLRAAAETRRLEKETGSIAPAHTGETLLGWPDFQHGRIAVIFSTLFVTPIRRSDGDWETQRYADDSQAHRLYRTQLDLYRRLTDEHPDKFRLLGSRADLDAVLAHWADQELESHPVGLLPLMEGAEGVRSPGELEDWWEWGLRIIGPAWAGTRFCGGTRDPGPLTDEGRALLAAMADLGFVLDLSHMDRQAVLQALDSYPGAIIASHANSAALLPGYDGNRQLTDEVIRGVLERDGIIGVVPFCKFLNNDWKTGDLRDGITFQTLAAQVDHICQLAGDARHVGLGSDFDGGYGLSGVPSGIDTIADLQKLGPVLSSRGYNAEQVAGVLGGNWLRGLQTWLP